MPVKKDLFQICASAAGTLVVESVAVELDIPVLGLKEVKAWIPSLDIGSNESHAIEAIVKKEVEISSTSQRRGRRLKGIDRRKLMESIPDDAHRALRILSCNDTMADHGINCNVDTAAGEFGK